MHQMNQTMQAAGPLLQRSFNPRQEARECSTDSSKSIGWKHLIWRWSKRTSSVT